MCLLAFGVFESYVRSEAEAAVPTSRAHADCHGAGLPDRACRDGGTALDRLRTKLDLLIVLLALSALLTASITGLAQGDRQTSASINTTAIELARVMMRDVIDARIAGRSDEAICEHLLRHEAIRGVRFTRADGTTQAAATAAEMPLQLLAPVEQSALGLARVSDQPIAVAHRSGLLHKRVDLPIPGIANEPAQTLTLALALPQPGGSSLVRLLPLLVPVLALCAAASLMGWRYVRKEIFRPLATIEQALGSDRRAELLAWIERELAGREDSLGRIARGVTHLHREADEWRRKAQQLERRVENQVASRTHAITTELENTRRALWRDPLTGLFNRRLFDDRFDEVFTAQHSAGADLSLVMIDLDHFKTLNDTRGHHAGDQLLRFAGSLIRQFVREDDLAIRLGGDEFLLVLPGVPRTEAEKLARRLAALFHQYVSVMPGLSRRPGLSVGIASLRHDRPATSAELFGLADQNMYANKQERRDSGPATSGRTAR